MNLFHRYAHTSKTHWYALDQWPPIRSRIPTCSTQPAKKELLLTCTHYTKLKDRIITHLKETFEISAVDHYNFSDCIDLFGVFSFCIVRFKKLNPVRLSFSKTQLRKIIISILTFRSIYNIWLLIYLNNRIDFWLIVR